MLVASTYQKFDLPKMKRLFGEPILIGDERMQDFEEYALAMAESLDPGDAAAHALVWQYILESHWYMRLLRFQGHAARRDGMSVEQADEAAGKAQISASEAKAFTGLERAFATLGNFDTLISQVAKRLRSLLMQIAMHRVALAEALKRKLELEERNVDVEYRKLQLKKDEELQRIVDENREKQRHQDQQTKEQEKLKR